MTRTPARRIHFRINKAGNYSPELQHYPCLVSPKLDGIRAYVGTDGVVYSGKNKRIPSEQVQDLFGQRRYAGLDGELIVGSPTAPDVFNKTQSFVMSRGKVDPQLRFHIFDLIDMTMEYTKRHDCVLKFLASTRPELANVPQNWCPSIEALQRWELKYVSAGYEGVMVRDPHGLYKQGRSTPHEGGLLKLKRFEDAEAVVIGFEEEEHNANEKVDGKRTSHKAGMSGKGTLGALQVQDTATNQKFNVGGGFTAAERQALWAKRQSLIGRVITYKHFPIGVKSAPRFPTFKGFRED
jgi:DNA ligase-1